MAHRDARTLMACPPNDRNVSWLQEMLQCAIKLELATIPPYLCAFWSIDEQLPTYGYIKQKLQRILSEEMAHLGLACNLLSAYQDPCSGSSPLLPTLNVCDVVPVYPGPLPGEIHPGLNISLSKLTKDKIGTQFMQLEFPSPEAVQMYNAEAFPTIGAFYQQIVEFVQTANPAVSRDYQVSSNRNYVFRIGCQTDALNAIAHISAEGEGAHGSPFVKDGGGSTELAHYYQFAEFFWQRKIVPCGTGGWGFCGAAIPWPLNIYDMADVPSDGYFTDDAIAFDVKYTELLDNLTLAWSTLDPVDADNIVANTISLMLSRDPGSLQDLAIRLMTTPLPCGLGNYGPCFRLCR
jgi:hypothetical protein